MLDWIFTKYDTLDNLPSGYQTEPEFYLIVHFLKNL